MLLELFVPVFLCLWAIKVRVCAQAWAWGRPRGSPHPSGEDALKRREQGETGSWGRGSWALASRVLAEEGGGERA